MVWLQWGKDLSSMSGLMAPAGWGTAVPAKVGAVVALVLRIAAGKILGGSKAKNSTGEGCRGPQCPRLGVSAVVARPA